MKSDIRNIIVVCVVLVSSCVNLPQDYYAPTASGGTFLPPAEPACFRQLDWVRLSDSGATFDIQAVRRVSDLVILLLVNRHNSHAPTVRINLGEISLKNATENVNHFPLRTDQADFRKSPTNWPIEPLVNTNGGYYVLRYADIADNNVEKFLLKFPDVLVGERVTKLPQVTFEKKYGMACDSGK